MFNLEFSRGISLDTWELCPLASLQKRMYVFHNITIPSQDIAVQVKTFCKRSINRTMWTILFRLGYTFILIETLFSRWGYQHAPIGIPLNDNDTFGSTFPHIPACKEDTGQHYFQFWLRNILRKTHIHWQLYPHVRLAVRCVQHLLRASFKCGYQGRVLFEC